MPHDSRSLVLIYGGRKEAEKRQQSRDSMETSLSLDSIDSATNNFKRRSNSMQSKALMASTLRRDQSKKLTQSNIFGDLKRSTEVPGYKRDAANLLVNRIAKKYREYFTIIQEFAAFQEVRSFQFMCN